MDQIFTNIDNIILGFVQGSFGSLTSAVQTFWRLMFTVFIAFYGYKIYISGRFSAPDLITHCIKMLLVLALATQWNAFFMFVYCMVTNLPSDIAGQIMQAAANSLGTQSQAATAVTANAALAQFYDRALTVCSGILEGAGIHIWMFFYAAIIWIAAGLFVAYATMLIILSKLAVAVILAVGPIFILLLIFNDTRKLFEGWLRTLINYALIPVFVYAMLALLLALIEPPLVFLESHSNVNSPALTGVAPFALITFIATLLLQQVMSIAANITGGVSLSTMGAVSQAIGTGRTVFARSKAGYATGKTANTGVKAINPRVVEKAKAGYQALQKTLGRGGAST